MGPKRAALPTSSAGPSGETALVRRNGRSGDQEDLSRALIKHPGRRIINPETTTRALVKRARETGGELILAKALTGPEKLRLKADLLTKNAVKEPFDMGELFRIADAQLQQQLAIIDKLQDPFFFYDDIVETVQARIESLGKSDPFKNPNFLAAAIGSRIHNAYYIAGTWKQVVLLLSELTTLMPPSTRGRDIPKLLKDKSRVLFRDRFILLYRVMSMLVGLCQKTVAMATAASPHYAHYFEKKLTANSDPYMTFRESEAMGAMKSLIDSIIMELVFPDSEYPLHVLYLCLKDTLDSSRREAKRFTQSLYNALGDLSETVRFLDMLDAALAGSPDAEKLKIAVPPYTPAFDAYLDAEWLSIKASRDNVHLRQYVTPLTKTRDPATLNLLWKNINLAYARASGMDIDHTWQLQDDRKPSPQWSYEYDGSLFTQYEDGASDYSDIDSDDDEKNATAIVLHKAKPKRGGRHEAGAAPSRPGKKSKAITAGGPFDPDDEPPDLISASESESDDDDDTDDDDDEEDLDAFDDYDEDNSEYDEDEEAELKKMFDQVMDAGEDGLPELADTWAQKAKEGKSSKNPFLKLFNRLSGRIFSLDPTLNSNRQFGPEPPPFTPKPKPRVPTKNAAKDDYADMPGLVKIPPLKKEEKPMPGLQAHAGSDGELPTLVPTIRKGAAPRARGVTVEEVEDEDEAQDKTKKKKKKKKKPKKKKAGEPEADSEGEAEAAPTSPVPASKGVASPQAPKSPPPSTKSKPAKAATPSIAPSYAPSFAVSEVSLHHPAGQTARSARSYLAQEGLIEKQQKAKTRGKGEPDKKGFMDKVAAVMSGREKRAKDRGAEPADEKKMTKFSITKKAGKLMHRLFSTDDQLSSLKWDHFVKAMVHMGFSYHPDTAGSSVRFDPPSSKDRPIHFHKPHPDSTIHYKMLREFRKKLQRYYGWSEEQFLDFDEAAQIEEID